MDTIRQTLADNLAHVESRLAAACERAGRSRRDVTLVGVTKSVSESIAAELFALGVRDLGEGRPQELWHKSALLPDARWHLVGHLQRNKIDRTLPLVHRLHSVDSLRLLDALEATPGERPIDVFLEVNCSGEAAKQGFAPEDTAKLGDKLRSLTRVRVCGLMTMAAVADDPEAARPTFARLRTLRDRMRDELGGLHPLDELSMGMSGDFEVAVEEGATCVRVGTILFTGLP
jgi:pyridoxal phosphate enzyme (YggS family)